MSLPFALHRCGWMFLGCFQHHLPTVTELFVEDGPRKLDRGPVPSKPPSALRSDDVAPKPKSRDGCTEADSVCRLADSMSLILLRNDREHSQLHTSLYGQCRDGQCAMPRWLESIETARFLPFALHRCNWMFLDCSQHHLPTCIALSTICRPA